MAFSVEDFQACIQKIESKQHKMVALQFPDDMLSSALELSSMLESQTGSTVVILADSSYSSCCVDYTSAKHVAATLIIHFGVACFSSQNPEIEVLYLYSKQQIDNDTVISKIRNWHELCGLTNTLVFYDHTANIGQVIGRLHSNSLFFVHPNFDNSSSATTLFGRVLPSCFQDVSNILFLGPKDSFFTNILGFFRGKEIFQGNPQSPNFEILAVERSKSNKLLSKRYHVLESLKTVSKLGIVIANLSSAFIISTANFLSTICERNGVSCSWISFGKLNEAKLSNFNEIDAYVLLSCYRIHPSDITFSPVPILNPYELLIKFDLYPSFFTASYINDLGYLEPQFNTLLQRCSENQVDESKPNSLISIEDLALSSRFSLKTFSGLSIDQNFRPLDVYEGLDGIASSYSKETNES